MTDDDKKLIISFFKMYFLIPLLGPWCYIQAIGKTIREGNTRVRLAMYLFLCLIFGGLFFVLVLPFCYPFNTELNSISKRHPGFPIIFMGSYLILFGLFQIFCMEAMALWSKNCREWLASKFPEWEKLSGLSTEKMKYYRSLDHNRSIVGKGATILLLIGLLSMLIGCLL